MVGCPGAAGGGRRGGGRKGSMGSSWLQVHHTYPRCICRHTAGVWLEHAWQLASALQVPLMHVQRRYLGDVLRLATVCCWWARIQLHVSH